MDVLSSADKVFGKREELHQYINSDSNLAKFKNSSICEVFNDPGIELNSSSVDLKARCAKITS